MSETIKIIESVIKQKLWSLMLKSVNVKTLTDVFNSLIRSLLDYSTIIYPYFSTTNIELLEKIQFKCLKIIQKKSKFESNITIKNINIQINYQ